MADALSRISDKCLTYAKAKMVLETIPIIPGKDTVFEVFEEEDKDKWPEEPAPYTMSSEVMKAVFDNLTLGARRRAEQEYNMDSATHQEANSIEVNVRSARLSMQMYVTDWAEAQREDLEIKAAMDWCHLNRKKNKLWMQQLAQPGLGLRRTPQKGKAYYK